MRITRITRGGGVYRPSGTGLDQIPDDGGMEGGGDIELEFDDTDVDLYDPMRIERNGITRVRSGPFRLQWLKRSRRHRFTRERYRYLSQLFDADEPNIVPLDHDEDFRRPERLLLWNFARGLKYRMIKRKRRKNQDKTSNSDPRQRFDTTS